ncbi:MAG: hypothetical protein K9L57_10270 [Spirochaetaceae bacterium]|nr:hypothetical protein [Spirochaetia bacterium]MCF7952008.1 hypothetical protein [Spirochaetaceae bacterium]
MSNEVENMIYDTRDFIRDNFNAYLSAINTDVGDGLTVKSVKDANIDLLDLDPFSHNEYPVIDIYPTDVEVGHMSMGSDQMGIMFTALVAINYGDAVKSSKMILRYVEAIRQILRDAEALGANGWIVDPDTPVSVAVYPSLETEIKIASITWQGIKDIGV